ncbi:MAG: PrsW family intramembrane metalloprotease [Gammaproteobacteria bacterium]|nr:PrsW family intramembrane metalloprotease [Gammaproteobacteria bacterium]
MMQQILLILPVVLPVIFWAVYHYHKDRHLPEPPLNLLLCFGLGLLAAAISKLMYAGLEPLGLRFDAWALAADNPMALLAYSMLAIGPIEEFAKMLPFLVIVMRFRAFDELLDGIVYASFIGLGYALAENLQYLDFLSPLEAAARGFAGPVVHILFASIWGYWISRARLSSLSVARAASLGFLLAAFLHGLYDFLVLLHPVAALPVAASLIVGIWIWRLRLMHRLHEQALRSND